MGRANYSLAALAALCLAAHAAAAAHMQGATQLPLPKGRLTQRQLSALTPPGAAAAGAQQPAGAGSRGA